MLQLVKHLKGHSGATVSLYKEDSEYFVIKENYARARESVDLLNALPFPTPTVYEVSDNRIVMEYINGLDIKTYLEAADTNQIEMLVDFLSEYITYCLNNSVMYDYNQEVLSKKQSIKKHINLEKLNFNTNLNKSIIHGDFTLENILYYNNQFYFIDANPTDLDSIVFDVNKLRQDLDCLWFVRNEKNQLHFKIICAKIKEKLEKRFPDLFDDKIFIFMLSRILPYTKDRVTKNFLKKEINKLWQ